MKYFSKISFNSSVVYLFAGLFIVLINLVWFIPTIGTMRHQISENETEIVKRSQSEIRSFLDNQVAHLAIPALFLNPDLGHSDNKAIVEKILNEPYFSKVSLLDKNGQELFRADRFSTVLEGAMEQLSDQQEFIAVMSSGRPFFGDIRFTETLEPLTVVAVPVSFVRGEVVGVLIAELNIRALFSSLDSIRSVSGGHIYVIDKRGDLISHRDPSLVLQQTNRRSLKVVENILFGAEKLVVKDDDLYTYENEKKETVLAAAGLIEETGWAVVFEEPKDIVMAPIRKIEIFALIIVILGIGVLIVLKRVNTSILNSKKAVEVALERAKQLAEEQSIVATLGQKVLENMSIDDLIAEVVAGVSRALDTEYVKVLELMPDDKQFLLRAGIGWKEGYVGHTMVGTGIESQAGFTLTAKKPVVVEDVTTETRFNAPPLLTEHGVISGLSVIIQGHERPFGVLGAHTVHKRSFTEEDVNFIQSVANILSEAIDKRRNEQLIAEHLQEVEKMNKLMIGRELKMIELKQKIRQLEQSPDYSE